MTMPMSGVPYVIAGSAPMGWESGENAQSHIVRATLNRLTLAEIMAGQRLTLRTIAVSNREANIPVSHHPPLLGRPELRTHTASH
jgi:hypothetical protein